MGRFLSIKKQDYFGKTHQGSHTAFLDVVDEKYAGENDLQIPEGISRSQRRYGPGAFKTEGGFSTPIDVRSLGLMLVGALGATSVDDNAIVTGAHEHLFWPAENIPAWEVDIGYDSYYTKEIVGVVFDKTTISCVAGENLKIAVDSPFDTYTLDATTTVLSPSYWGLSATLTDDILLGFHEANCKFGDEGEIISAQDIRQATKIEVNISNEIDLPDVMGKRTPYYALEQGRIVEGNLDFIVDDDPAGAYNAEDEIKRFLGSSTALTPQDKLEAGSIGFEATSAHYATATTPHKLQLYMPRTVYKKGDPNMTGKGALMQTVEFTAFEAISAPSDPWTGTHADAPDKYEIVAVLINDVITAYDA